MRSAPIVALLAVVLLAGCGSASPPDPDDPPPDQASDTGAYDGAGSAGTPPHGVVSVSMTQQGGLAGVVRSWRITERSPRHERVFAAADRSLLEGSSARAAGQAPCCDLLEYEVVVRYADGTSMRMRTWDGDSTNLALLDLVTTVIDSEPWQLDAGDGLLGGDVEKPSTGSGPSA